MKAELKNLFYKIGYLPPSRIPEPRKLIKEIKSKDFKVQEHELRKNAKLLMKTNRHDFYEEFIRCLVPNKELTLEYPKFIGHGRGRGLNVYRKGKISNHWSFEKIYFNSSKEIDRCLWFYQHIERHIEKSIRIPKPIKVYKADLVSIIYFEYFDLKPLPPEQIEFEILNVIKGLQLSFRAYKNDSRTLNIPEFIKDYSDNGFYKRKNETAHKKLIEAGINVEALKKKINDSQKVWTHSDLYNGNVFRGPIVLDWDSFGFFPIGFEQARAYFGLLRQHSMNIDFDLWLKHNFHSSSDTGEWEEFNRNYLYFLLIFIQELKGKRDTLEKSIITSLKQYT